ncbi:solute carrier family 23 protein [Turicimonas muris]|uniref:Pyrimidine utilization transport protein G n=2 Tax=Turicimonas muris TaxID=1796652 RepID=A0A227KAF0_9BURK|nr:solute carrier family 23 protein [Turicimonas muris]ANU66541.1 pyrimidine utilization transport protein G [Burkholderiales bacterium YL45]OXE44301.1 pyrimidine utilization transport protein G [Turicimonas muris]QQQ97692.1 purine/pyrimidine permease [Turicimonas muris]
MLKNYFPAWKLKQEGVIAPDERLPLSQTIAMGLQHVVIMFGSTVLAPLLMGLNPNIAVLMSGIGTLVFFFIVGGQVPSYLGSSFAFIGVVIAATGYSGSGPNPNIGIAMSGVVACGVVYALIGLIVMKTGVKWIERLMPPVVTGAVVMVIGLNLAPVAVKGMGTTSFEHWYATAALLIIGFAAVYLRGFLQKLLMIVGILISYVVYWMLTNVLGFGKPIDFSAIQNAAWLGVPEFTAPVFDIDAIVLIVPVVVILVAENLGHIKAVNVMTHRNLDPYIGRAFFGDGIATILAGFAGGPGVTTYGENIGVMAATRVYSTLIFPVAACFAILLGFSPKFGAVIQSIPGPLLGAVSVVVFGFIAAAGARIWVESKVDLSTTRNLIVVAITLIVGTGDFSLTIVGFNLGGIGTATLAAIGLNLLFALKENY